MSLYKRSHSFGSSDYESDEKIKKKRSRSNSIFASAWSLFVGTEEEKSCDDSTPVDSPEVHKEVHLTKEDAWMQACYTAMALVFVFISGCIFLAVYYILEPFLHPLLWAVLVGMVLHPFKHASTSEIDDWLSYLDTSGIPLSVGLVLSPLFIFNWLSQSFENIFFSNWRMLLGVVVCTITMVFCYVFNIPVYTYAIVQFVSGLVEKVDVFMAHTGFVQVCSLIVGFFLLLIMSNRYSDYKTPLKALSLCLWFLALLNLGVYLCGAVAIPIVATLFLTSIVISFVWSTKKEDNTFKISAIVEQSKGADIEEGILEKGLTLANLKRMTSEESTLEVEIERTETLIRIDDQTGNKTSPGQTEELSGADSEKEQQGFSDFHQELEPGLDDQSKQVSFGPPQRIKLELPEDTPPPLDISDLAPLVKQTTPGKTSKESSKSQRRDGSPKPIRGLEEVDGGRFRRLASPHKESERARAQSNQVFLMLFIACLMVTLWKYPILLLIPIPLASWCVIKYVITLAVIQNSVVARLSNLWTTLKTWLNSQRKVLFPWPMPTMFQMYLFIDKHVLGSTKKTIGSLMSAFIIIVLLVIALAVAVVLVFQIQVEVMHYFSAAVSVWNATIATNPQIQEWMGIAEGNETFQDTLENFASQNYVYAREWLADRIHSLVSDSSANTTNVEQRVLELFDRLYNIYVVQNSSTVSDNTCTNTIINDEVMESTDDHVLWTVSELLPLINTDTTVTVLKSLWSILSDNLPVAFSFLYAILELLFSGGTALLNTIVFLSALFYLLSYSEKDYLPVKWIMDFLPHLTPANESERGGASEVGGANKDGGEESISGDEHGKVFSRAIRSVFHAAFRRAFFYGLYTWLTHTLFGLPVSILPAVLAGIAGAIPFIGSYWVAVPAFLELWLLQGHLLVALSFLALSLLPVFFVDTLINREIEGGHPYLTGLAIAGGIYFAGLEGALIGPILLSCLLFVIDFYDDSFF